MTALRKEPTIAPKTAAKARSSSSGAMGPSFPSREYRPRPRERQARPAAGAPCTLPGRSRRSGGGKGRTPGLARRAGAGYAFAGGAGGAAREEAG